MPENTPETLLDAVNAAIPAPEPVKETPQAQETPEVEAATDTEQADEAAPEGEEAGEGAADGEEGEDDAEEAEGDEEADEKAEEKPEAKDPDHLNDPIPRGTLERTQKRITSLIGMVKEESTKRETVEKNYTELIGEISGAGMGANEFNHMLEYARGVNSGSYEGMKRSYDILMSELTNLATAIGEPLPGRNPLEGHPDLIAAVDAKQVTPALAVETAMARNRQAAAQKIGQQRSNVTQTQAQVQQATTAAKAGLTDLGKQLAQQDGVAEYRRKAGIVVGMLQEAFHDTIPPQKWVSMFKKAYDQLPKAAPAVVAAKKPVIPANQPMRGNKRPSGDSTKQPKTMLDAINAAFEQ